MDYNIKMLKDFVNLKFCYVRKFFNDYRKCIFKKNFKCVFLLINIVY